jgi:hypothetical protein
LKIIGLQINTELPFRAKNAAFAGNFSGEGCIVADESGDETQT